MSEWEPVYGEDEGIKRLFGRLVDAYKEANKPENRKPAHVYIDGQWYCIGVDGCVTAYSPEAGH